MEKVCYGIDLDPAIRSGIKSSKSSEEMLTAYTPFKEETDKLNATLTDEKEKKADASKGAAAKEETAQPKTKMIEETVQKEKADEQHKEDPECPWKRYVERLLDSRAHLFAEHETVAGNTNHLKELEAAKVKAQSGSSVAICFSSNLNAEGVTNPHCRNPPLRKDRLQKIGQAIIRSRSHLFQDEVDHDPESLGTGDILIGMGGAKNGNHTKLVNWIRGSKVVRKITLFYDYESIKERKFRLKGVGTMAMTEGLLLASTAALRFPEFKYESVPGGSKDDTYGPMKVVVGSSVARLAVAVAIIDRMVSASKLPSHASCNPALPPGGAI